MTRSLENLIAVTLKQNPNLAFTEAVSVAKQFIVTTDPHNLSYTSARSGHRAQVHDDVSTALSCVHESPVPLDLVSEEGTGGVHQGVTYAQVHVDARRPSLDSNQGFVDRTTGLVGSVHSAHSFDSNAARATSTPALHSSIFGLASQTLGTVHKEAVSAFVPNRAALSVSESAAEDFKTPIRISASAHKVGARSSNFPVQETVSSRPIPTFHKFSSTLTSQKTDNPRTLSSCIVYSAPTSKVSSKDLPSANPTSFTQTGTLSRPSLSIQPGPSAFIRPIRRKLTWTKLDIWHNNPIVCKDKEIEARPTMVHRAINSCPVMVDRGTSMSDKGTSPSVSPSIAPEPPAIAATQDPSVSSSPGRPAPSSGAATQGPSSSSVSIPPTPSQAAVKGDDSDKESVTDSVVLADPDDPETELLSASESFSILKKKIVQSYSDVESDKKVVEKSSFQSVFEREKPKISSLRMTPAVKLRLAALDEELLTKKTSSSSVTVFSPYLKNHDFKYYLTELVPDFEAQASLLASMAGVLDQTRVKRFKKSKIAFTITELDSIFKSAYRALEIWSYASSSFAVLGECFLDLKEKLPQEHRELAIQYTSLLQCVDKAGRHGIGETVNIVANLILKKREHVMSLAHATVPLSTKTDIIFAPISSCKLLPVDEVKAATAQFRQQTETSALVAVAAASKASTSRPLLRGSTFRGSSSSPLTDRRFKLGRIGGTGKASKKFFLRNRDFFNRRDRFNRGRGQGKKSQPSSSNSQ